MSEIIVNVRLKDVIDDITQDLTSIFLTIDSMSLHGHNEKFDEFRPVSIGIDTAYQTMLHASGIEVSNDTEILLLEYYQEIYDKWDENKITKEYAWELIREITHEIT